MLFIGIHYCLNIVVLFYIHLSEVALGTLYIHFHRRGPRQSADPLHDQE